jgi:hypothetical protein
MIKNIIFLVSIYLVIVLINGCSSGREAEKENEKKPTITKKIPNIEVEERGHVKSQNIKEIEKLDFDFDSKGKLISRGKLSTIEYDPDGFITETIVYDSKNKVENKFSYDYKNNIRIKTTRYTPDGMVDKYYLYEYNKYGNKIKSIRYNLSNDMDKYYNYDYGEEGNLIKEAWYDKNGNEEYRIEYEYDDNGRKITAETYNQNGDLVSKYKFRYDAKGNIIEEEKYSPRGIQTGIIQYVYKYY